MTNTPREKKFYPDYLFEILVVCLAALEIVLALSYFLAPRIGRPIDFSRNFQPLPEWYFLFLYQLFKRRRSRRDGGRCHCGG